MKNVQTIADQFFYQLGLNKFTNVDTYNVSNHNSWEVYYSITGYNEEGEYFAVYIFKQKDIEKITIEVASTTDCTKQMVAILKGIVGSDISVKYTEEVTKTIVKFA